MSMFIAIATDDFLTFMDNNEAERYTDYTNETDCPIFTGETIEETCDRVKSYFNSYYGAKDDIPEYEICKITTATTIKGAYKLTIDCSLC